MIARWTPALVLSDDLAFVLRAVLVLARLAYSRIKTSFPLERLTCESCPLGLQAELGTLSSLLHGAMGMPAHGVARVTPDSRHVSDPFSTVHASCVQKGESDEERVVIRDTAYGSGCLLRVSFWYFKRVYSIIFLNGIVLRQCCVFCSGYGCCTDSVLSNALPRFIREH